MNQKADLPTRSVAFSNRWDSIITNWTKFISFGTFIRELISNPRAVGAACPSSRKLALRMASFIPNHLEGIIVELGAGTGVVTSALLDRGIPPHRIIAIERSSDLTLLLKRRFPQVTIIHGDAQFLGKILAPHLSKKNKAVDVVVSSLPLRSLPKSVVQAIEKELTHLLSKEGRFIQFTYDLRTEVAGPFRCFVKRASKIVWRNLPPARVDVFQLHH